MTAIIENTETAHAMDAETTYPIEIEMFNEVLLELEFNQNIIVKGDNPQITRAVQCYIIDKKATQKRMNEVITQYLNDAFIKEFGEEIPKENTINPFDKVITELNRYTQQTSITYYHRIMMVELVRVVKDKDLVGRVVNKKSGVKYEYTDKQKIVLIRHIPPKLRRTTLPEEMDYKITIYPILTPNQQYRSPTTLCPITITFSDVLKRTPFNLPNSKIPLEYKIIVDIEYNNKAVIAEKLVSNTCDIIYNKLLTDKIIVNRVYLPTPYRRYKKCECIKNNTLLTLLSYIKYWDKNGNPTLKGLTADEITEDNSYIHYSRYTTKCDLEMFMINSGYIQNKLIENGETITIKRVNKMRNEIFKMRYRDIVLWMYKEF